MWSLRHGLLAAIAAEAFCALAASAPSCSSVAQCRQKLVAATEKRISIESHVGGFIAQAEADAVQAEQLLAAAKTSPQEIRRSHAAESALQERAASLEVELAQINATLARAQQAAAEKSSHSREAGRSAVSADRLAVQAQRNLSLAERDEVATAAALKQAKAREDAARRKTKDTAVAVAGTPLMSTAAPSHPPLLYRPIHNFIEWLGQPSYQWLLAGSALALGAIGLAAPAKYQLWSCWLFSVFGLPAAAALLAKGCLAELLAASSHWGLLLNVVPMCMFLLLAVAMWRGFHGVHYLHGAWVGKSLGCIIPNLPYLEAWEAMLVRFIFLMFGLAIARNVTVRLRTRQVGKQEAMPHLCFASMTSLCGLLLASALVFFVDRGIYSQSHSWLDIVKGLLGYDKPEEDLRHYWVAGALVWLVAVILRMWFYVFKESSFWKTMKDEALHADRDSPEPHQQNLGEPLLATGSLLSPSQLSRVSEEGSEDASRTSPRLPSVVEALAVARKDSARLLSGKVSEGSAELYEVVSLLTCTAGVLGELREALDGNLGEELVDERGCDDFIGR